MKALALCFLLSGAIVSAAADRSAGAGGLSKAAIAAGLRADVDAATGLGVVQLPKGG